MVGLCEPSCTLLCPPAMLIRASSHRRSMLLSRQFAHRSPLAMSLVSASTPFCLPTGRCTKLRHTMMTTRQSLLLQLLCGAVWCYIHAAELSSSSSSSRGTTGDGYISKSFSGDWSWLVFGQTARSIRETLDAWST